MYEIIESGVPEKGTKGIVISFEGTHRPQSVQVWEGQRNAMRRVMPGDFIHLQVAGPYTHADHVNRLVSDLRLRHESLKSADEKSITEFEKKIIVLLDMDCIVLSPRAFSTLTALALEGTVVGNAQRSNHLENGQHVYAAPSCLAISVETLVKLGWPSASPSLLSDCCEDWTWIAEDLGIPVKLLKPISFEEIPVGGVWPLDGKLGPNGIGTTFGSADGEPMTWHCFQQTVPPERWRSWAKRIALDFVNRRRPYSISRVGRIDRSNYVAARFESLQNFMESNHSKP